ncbi:hypothetical protein KCH_72560 [Kitasatospora cheerisanensis KCTC 2395]|uniref:Uncharacterized protein n=1 Tax=Kitasatospora cheerisanensis KCTC 2395 TaxID=1348663 RepID=A0A066YHK7_9ACTN|nr:hypothetical protein KCH_72560 [Kitasatospora cheerisanensis KCTC 2395]
MGRRGERDPHPSPRLYEQVSKFSPDRLPVRYRARAAGQRVERA